MGDCLKNPAAAVDTPSLFSYYCLREEKSEGNYTCVKPILRGKARM